MGEGAGEGAGTEEVGEAGDVRYGKPTSTGPTEWHQTRVS